MDAATPAGRFAALTTAHVADGCLRAGVAVRCGPAGLQAALPGARLAGRVVPVRHAGSVDVFLEAFETAAVGDVLVVDNGGRTDESCVGDLVVQEAAAASLGGIVIWGLHRDSAELRRIGLPVFSLGHIPTGPLDGAGRTPALGAPIHVGEQIVQAGDVVLGDDDGVLFVPAEQLETVLAHAERIRDTEVAQADRIRAGTSLREQVRFRDHLERRRADPDRTFRQHLREVGGEIEV